MVIKGVNNLFTGERYICMPLKKNVPEGHKGWRLTKCPECGRECWQNYLKRKEEILGGAIPLCTECALRKG